MAVVRVSLAQFPWIITIVTVVAVSPSRAQMSLGIEGGPVLSNQVVLPDHDAYAFGLRISRGIGASMEAGLHVAVGRQ